MKHVQGIITVFYVQYLTEYLPSLSVLLHQTYQENPSFPRHKMTDSSGTNFRDLLTNTKKTPPPRLTPTSSTRFPAATILQPMTDKHTDQFTNASLNTRVISYTDPFLTARLILLSSIQPLPTTLGQQVTP